ncbi:CMRF35-like molecule 1 isoform X5 [Dipodomys merriami]|uniref:CMRF35-like molecule 1 isoform X5 n=1 Tax=Dipodomys merriami TaxID=94247 RepID=UPI003855B903
MYLPLLFLLVSWLLGCCSAETDISGPRTVSGPEQGSLTVQCPYASSWKTYNKWWCQGAGWSSCKILVQTSAEEQKVKRGHVSITDDQTNFTIVVTMEDLRMSDADVYWCGIQRIGTDLGVEVQVKIHPAPSTVLTTVPTTSTATTFSASTSVEETSFFTTLINVNVRHRVIEVSILLPVIFAALLLLLVAAAVLAWMKMKRQKKAAEPSAEKADAVTPSLHPPLQPQEDELCYANLSLHQPGASSSSSQHKASIKPSSAGQEEVEYVTMAPLPKTEVSYASLSLDALHQEPTYSNTHIPGTGPETTTEYSSVRWP